MKHISLLVIPGALGSAITIPLEMCTAANDIARARKQAEKACRLELVATEDLHCTLTGNLSLECHKLLSAVERTDLVFVPAVWRTEHGAEEVAAPEDGASGFFVQLRDGRLAHVHAPRDGASVVFLLGDGWVSALNPRLSRTLRSAPHYLAMPPPARAHGPPPPRRLWFGAMLLPNVAAAAAASAADEAGVLPATLPLGCARRLQ